MYAFVGKIIKLDSAAGVFYWQIDAAFQGSFRFQFQNRNREISLSIKVNIEVKLFRNSSDNVYQPCYIGFVRAKALDGRVGSFRRW